MTSATERIWYEYSVANATNPAQLHRWRLAVGEVARAASPHASVVDLGCGSGALLRRIAAAVRPARLAGVDVEPRAIALAREALPGADIVLADLDHPTAALDALQGTIDVAVCSEVLEHLEHPLEALRLAARLLRPGGTLVVTVPAGPMNHFDRSIGHRTHYSIASLTGLLSSADLRVTRRYLWGFPFHTLYRIGIAAFPGAVDGFSDTNITPLRRLLFRALDLLFYLNVRSRRAGRQIVAVATTTI